MTWYSCSSSFLRSLVTCKSTLKCWSTWAISAIALLPNKKILRTSRIYVSTTTTLASVKNGTSLPQAMESLHVVVLEAQQSNLAARANLQRPTSDKILTQSDLFRFCGKQLHGIKFLSLQNRKSRQEKRFENGFIVPGARENHCFKSID